MNFDKLIFGMIASFVVVMMYILMTSKESFRDLNTNEIVTGNVAEFKCDNNQLSKRVGISDSYVPYFNKNNTIFRCVEVETK